jgi:hypothetical protein
MDGAMSSSGGGEKGGGGYPHPQQAGPKIQSCLNVLKKVTNSSLLYTVSLVCGLTAHASKILYIGTFLKLIDFWVTFYHLCYILSLAETALTE